MRTKEEETSHSGAALLCAAGGRGCASLLSHLILYWFKSEFHSSSDRKPPLTLDARITCLIITCLDLSPLWTVMS